MVDDARLIAREWLRKADHDLGMATLGIESGSPYTDGICFHCQQAAEKYVKGVIAFRGLEVPRTHDLAALLDVVDEIAAVADDFYDSAELLNGYAVDIRYPTGRADPSSQEAVEALSEARRWREFALRETDTLPA